MYEAEGKVKARVSKVELETPNLRRIWDPRFEEDCFASRKTRSLVEEVVETILRGTGKVACPECRAVVDKNEQDRENQSNAYFCANCGLILYKQKINVK